MSLWVACSQCRTEFPADSHAGLVRCGECCERMGFRLHGTGAHTVAVA